MDARRALFSRRTFGPGVARLLGMSKPLLRQWTRKGYFSGVLTDVPLERVLLVACDWIGDTFWASQVAAPLTERLGPDAVWVATRRRARDLWRGLVPDERVIVLEHVVSDRRREGFTWAGLRAEAAHLRAQNFDVVLDLTGNRYSALLSFLSRPRRAFGCDGDELQRLYSIHPTPLPAEAHLALRPWHVSTPLLGPAPTTPPQPICTLGDEGVPADLQPWLTKQRAIVAPGAGWPSKQWPPERFTELAEDLEFDLGLEVLVVGGEHEQTLLEQVASETERGRVLPGLSLPATCRLLNGARLVVSNDSAIGHLGAALGTPTVSLFNSTNPALYRPLGPRVRVLRSGCPDRPEGAQVHCHDRAEHPCPTTCWDTLTNERVLAECQRAILG